MAKIPALKLAIFLSLSLFLPASVSSQDQKHNDHIVAVARLYSPKYVIAPGEEVGGPYEGEIYLGGVYSVNVKIVRVISGGFDIVPKHMRLIANSDKYFIWSEPKLIFVEKSEKFGYRIASWVKLTGKESKNICLPKDIVTSNALGTTFAAPDGHGNLCEHSPDQSPG